MPRCTEVTSSTNSGNDSNSDLKYSHSRTNHGVRIRRSADRSIKCHIRFGMRRSRKRKYVSETKVQNRSAEMVTSWFRSARFASSGETLSQTPAEELCTSSSYRADKARKISVFTCS